MAVSNYLILIPPVHLKMLILDYNNSSSPPHKLSMMKLFTYFVPMCVDETMIKYAVLTDHDYNIGSNFFYLLDNSSFSLSNT